MSYGWFGDYSSWEEALIDVKGYDDTIIFEKTKKAIQKIIQKENTYERDTVVFDRVEYEYHQAPLIGILKTAILLQKKELCILDFGGSLGTLYFALRDLLDPLILDWNIIEQSHYIEYGKKNIFDIKFFYTINEFEQYKKVDIIILSSVLQYLEKPYEILSELIKLNPKVVIIDRTAVFTSKERLTIQKVPPVIYDSSYPAWFLNESKLKNIFEQSGYILDADFINIDKSNIKEAKFRGYIYVKNSKKTDK